MFDFPDAPTQDQTVDVTTIKRFYWNGDCWRRGIIPPRTPVITQLIPYYGEVNDPTQECRIIGTDFNAGSIVNWNGADIASTFVSATELLVTVPVRATEGTVVVYVTNVGVPASNTLPYDYYLNSGNPPIFVGAAPTFSGSGATGDFTITIDGFYFAPNTVVLWNGVETGTTTWDGSYRIYNVVQIDTLAPGDYTLTVRNLGNPDIDGAGSGVFNVG